MYDCVKTTWLLTPANNQKSSAHRDPQLFIWRFASTKKAHCRVLVNKLLCIKHEEEKEDRQRFGLLLERLEIFFLFPHTKFIF